MIEVQFFPLWGKLLEKNFLGDGLKEIKLDLLLSIVTYGGWKIYSS